MKIVSMDTFLVPPRWLFLRVRTDEGITGWGEPVVEGRAATVREAVAELSDHLIGATRCASRTTGRSSPRAASTGAGRCCPARWPGSTRRCGTSRARRRYARRTDRLGLGVEVDERAVERAAELGHRWRGPIWRHPDGSFAEW